MTIRFRAVSLSLIALLLFLAFAAVAVASKSDRPLGASLTPVQDGTRHTLQLDLSGVRVREVRLTGLHVGASGVSTVLDVGGGGPLTRMTVGTLTVDGLTCKTLTVSSALAGAVVVTGNHADGNSLHYNLDTIPAQIIGSDRGMLTVAPVVGSTYDRVVIIGDASTVVRTLVIEGMETFGGVCLLHDVAVGTLSITDSTLGNGDGLAVPDLQVTVNTASVTDSGNVEELVSVK